MASRPSQARLPRRRAALRWLARWLGRWADSVLQEEREGAPPPAGEPGLPLQAGGPPAHWVERVREGAPELLVPGPPLRVGAVEQIGRIGRIRPIGPIGPITPERPHPRPSSPRPSSPAPSQPPSPGEEGERALITPALFSHRPPPNREKRENSQTAPAGFPSPGRREGGGRGDRGEGLGRGREEPIPIPRLRESGPPAHWVERVRQAAPQLLPPELVGCAVRTVDAGVGAHSAPYGNPARLSPPSPPGAGVRGIGADFASELPRPRPSPLPLSRPPHPPPRERDTRLEQSCWSPSSPGEGGWEGTGEEGRGDEGLGWGSSEAKRSSPPPPPAATAPPPVFPGLFAARIDIPAERSAQSRPDRRWPALPEPREEPEDPVAERAALQAWERRRRLDREQQGV